MLAEYTKLEDRISPFESFNEFVSVTSAFDSISNNKIDLIQVNSALNTTISSTCNTNNNNQSTNENTVANNNVQLSASTQVINTNNLNIN